MTMKITMIGKSNAGKTCFTVATYAKMMRGVSGFKFSATSYDKAMKLRRMWRSLTSAENPQWPVGTFNAPETFSFSCRYNERPLIPGTQANDSVNMFQWIDYRGGLWDTEQGGEDTKTEIGKLCQYSADSDALIVAIPGDVLVKCAKNQDDDVIDMLDLYETVLDQLSRKNLEAFQRAAIIFMITKGDCIDSEVGINDEMNACFRKVKKTFDFCFGVTQRACMITAVSLGKNFGCMAQGGKMKGTVTFRPINLHLPILLPFYLWIRDEDRKTRALFEAAKNDENGWLEKKKNESKKSGWSKFWNGDNTNYYGRRAGEAKQLYEKYKEASADLLNAAENIKQELTWRKPVVLYEYGKRTICSNGLDI